MSGFAHGSRSTQPWPARLRLALRAGAIMALVPAVLGGTPALAAARTDAASPLNVVPWPKAVEVSSGVMPLSAKSRIVYRDATLAPLANVLADEILRLTGTRLATVSGKPGAGDISLELDLKLKQEACRLKVAESAVVRGGNYNAVALGTVTLLQLITGQGAQITVPCLAIDDEPKMPYRGLGLDAAEGWNSIETLKQCVELCRLYKIRYLCLRLTGDRNFFFPSTAFPRLSAIANMDHAAYSIEELRGLEQFAVERGVAIVPELPSFYTTQAMMRGWLPVFGGLNWVLHITNEKTYAALDTLVGEMCDVFKSSPYFHISCYDGWYQPVEEARDFGEYCKTNNLSGSYDVFLRHVVRMNDMVKKRGKQSLVWESFKDQGSKIVTIPNDIIVMGTPSGIMRRGYTTISATDLVPYGATVTERPPKDMFAEPPVPSSPQCLGAQMRSCQHRGVEQLPGLRPLLPALSERTWNPEAGRDYADFARRCQAIDSRLVSRLVTLPAVMELQGVEPGGSEFRKTLTLTAQPLLKGATLRYALEPASAAENDAVPLWALGEMAVPGGKEVTKDSPVCSAPIKLEDSTTVMMRCFNGDGQPVGYEYRNTFVFAPVAVEAKGLAAETEPTSPPNVFHDTLSLTMRSPAAGKIRYTLDGSAPSKDSTAYSAPIVLEDTTAVRARLFDDQGAPRGKEFRVTYEFDPVSLVVKGLATEKDPKAAPNTFAGTLTLTMPSHATGTIRYTLDGKEPTAQSPQYTTPIRLEDSALVWARYFNAKGAPYRKQIKTQYNFIPLSLEAQTTLDPTCPPPAQASDTDMRVFCVPMKITLHSELAGAQIRYGLDGEALKKPSDGLEYKGPFDLTRPAYFVAQCFDKDGKARGKQLGGCFYTYEKNITTGKPVTSSGDGADNCVAARVVDGCTWHEAPWMSPSKPDWLQVDLQKVCKLDRVHVTTYWSRVYQYTIELSVDGKTWTKVVDQSANKDMSSPAGELYTFTPTESRYIRVSGLGILVELRAYQPGDKVPGR